MPRAARNVGNSPGPPPGDPPATTADHAPRPASAPAPPASVVAGPAPRLAARTNALCQRRLRAAAGALLVVISLFFARRLSLGVTGFWPLQAGILSLMATALAILATPRAISQWGLKILEAAIFGLAAASLALRQYSIMVRSVADPALSIQEATKSTLLGSLLLMFSYCMLIPNTWRSAAKVVLGIAAVPLLTQVFTFLVAPEVFRSARDTETLYSISENVMFLMTGAGLAIFGVHVIGSLRVEAFEARRLNQYQLGDRLGSGGMGEVYLAEHRFLKRPCALKLIKPEKAGDARALVRFEREVRATARLSHPNTIEIYDYGRTEDGTFYYVMEFLRGRSLEDLVMDHGAMPPGRVIYLLRQACEALAEAHDAGMVHRDVKPANLFAAERGGRKDVAKVLDFGLVKDTSAEHDAPALSREGTVRGTPHFMAPEQVTADSRIDRRADVYAMGAVAYCLLTGRPPFDHPTATRVMIAHARDPVEPPSRINPLVPDDLERVVLRCLEKKPEDRYPDAQALADALAACRSAPEWDAARASRWWAENEVGLPSSSATAATSILAPGPA